MSDIRYWLNGDRPWEFEVSDVDVLWHEANAEVGRLYNTGGGTYVDEIAVLMPNREMASNFIMRAVGEGRCTYFNASEDTVHTEPLRTVYDVAYHFIRIPDRPYRLEVMHLKGGHSPLHYRLSAGTPESLPIVHASFKPLHEPDSEIAYDEALDLLWHRGYRPSQQCESDYGRFSYWRKDGGPLFFLKPRVNIRDVVLPPYSSPTPVVGEFLPFEGALPKGARTAEITDLDPREDRL